LFSFDKNQALRSLKPFLPKGFSFDKAQTPLNSKPVNILSLPDFELLLFELICAGNPIAKSFGRDLVGLSLQQLFCDAFGLKFEAEDRQSWLLARQESKDLFYDLANAIKKWTEGRECSAPAWTYYSNAYDAINLGLFGMKSAKIREALELPAGSGLCRDHFGRSALRHLIQVQGTASRMMARDPGLKPIEAVKVAIRSNMFESQDYRD
jgi:hypothetical protein